MIHKDLTKISMIGVIVHEFIEMIASGMLDVPDCCLPEYNQKIHGKKNALAHHIADCVERRILSLGGYSWAAHQKRCKKISENK